MVLMLAGARRSLRARPRPAPALLAAAYGWAAANGWRATFLRVSEVRRGGALEHGGGELWAVAIATGIALGCLALSLYLVVRADRPPPAAVDDPGQLPTRRTSPFPTALIAASMAGVRGRRCSIRLLRARTTTTPTSRSARFYWNSMP
jgi:hypothetical protein